MKFIKYAILTFILASIVNTVLVFAYPSPSSTFLNHDLDKNNSQWTDYMTKYNWKLQTYENTDTFTWLTNPCSDCQIAAKPYTESGDIGVAVVTKEDQKKGFTDPTSFYAPDNYRLNIWRLDFTLLTTHHFSVWTINNLN